MLALCFFAHQKQQILQTHMHKKIYNRWRWEIFVFEPPTDCLTDWPNDSNEEQKKKKEENMAFAAVSYTPDYRIHR